MALKLQESGVKNQTDAGNQNSMRTRQKDYALSIEKSLVKKLEATRRNASIEYQMTGGGLKGMMDTASYELMKRAIEQYYVDFPKERGTVRIDKDIDQKGAVVASVIRVFSADTHLYTINLYHTRCTFLVNGKKVDEFLSVDIPKVHELLNNVVLDGKAIDLGALNQIMAHQLQQAIERQSSMVNESTVKKCPRSITDKDNECFKCKRNLKSRATWCDTGMHWIHYNCERLSEEEIRKIQAEPDSEAYTCKLCKSERENNKYITMSINEPEAQISTQITLPKTPHLTDVGSILQDELIGSEDNCHVCDSVINDAGVPCSDCKMIAHMKCSMNSDEETICLNCCAMNDQTQHEQAVSQVSVRQCHPTQSVQNIFISESQNKKQDICGQDLGTTIPVNVNKVITENAPTATATQELIKQTELNSVDISSEQKTVKQSELRQREQKLRKKEE